MWIICVRNWNNVMQRARMELWRSLPGTFSVEPSAGDLIRRVVDRSQLANRTPLLPF